MAKRINPADATRLQRLLSVTMSGGQRTTQRNRASVVADAVGFVLFVVVLVFVWVALP